MNHKQQRALLAFRERLNRLPLAKHPGLLFNPWVEGFRDHTFGGRAGPSVGIENVFHELGHAAQFGPENFRARCKPHGYVFNTRKVCLGGIDYSEPLTRQSTDRELDTFSHQLHLMRRAGLKVSDAKYFKAQARLMRFMPDWYSVPGDSDESRNAFCEAQLQERYATTSPSETLARLEGWLDKTARRLKRSGSEASRPYRKVESRYRLDGTVLA